MDDYFWINPLKLDKYRDYNEDPEIVAQLKSQTIDSFFNNVVSAERQITDMKTYILDVRHPEIDLQSLASQRYKFLRVSEEILTINDEALKKIFHHLQKFAVALYEIINNTLETEMEYRKRLSLTREKMKQMIANIQLALTISNLETPEDVTYAMLPARLKVTQPSQRALRDIIVIRDYCEFLQNLSLLRR